jgi:predicted protein tyrosine phosphatase
MSMIHVCSLARLYETVGQTRARHVVTLLKQTDRVVWPAGLAPDNHLILGMDDIVAPIDGYVHPADEHILQLIDFARAWDRTAPMVVHCYAGISRSTAGAFVAACALNPARSELAIAQAIRSASASAMPNARIVALADRALDRNGRMIAAIETIGPGEMAYEGSPFRLDLE